MQDFLIIKLQGAMQAWGGHTFEDYRPSHIFPTRSAVVGLVGACLGIDRADIQGRADLNASFELTVRADQRKVQTDAIQKPHYTPSLGRRSCPIQRPLFETIVAAENAQQALTQIEPKQGTLYSEQKLQGSASMQIRDVPIQDPVRQFATRTIYILGDSHVL